MRDYGLTTKTRRHQTANDKILFRLEMIPLGGFLGVLRVLAVNADPKINRQDTKDAKKTPSKTIWLRLRRSRFIRGICGNFGGFSRYHENGVIESPHSSGYNERPVVKDFHYSELMMKRIWFSFLVIAAAGALPLRGFDNAPTIVFDSTTKDFGKVTQGETLKHIFKFTNKGNATLEIASAEPS
jgi:hypothetical protein